MSDIVQRAVHEALAAAIGNSFSRAEITPGEDRDGDRALYIRAYLKPNSERPSSATSMDAMVALRKRLRAAGDTQQPYLLLDYPYDEDSAPRGRAA